MIEKIIGILRRALLVSLCYLYAPVRHTAQGHIDKDTTRSIMILSLAQLGDTISLTPLFHQTKLNYPNARLYVASKAGYRDLLAHNTDIDEFVPFDEQKVWDFIRFLRRAKIDIAVLPQANFFALAALFLAGVRHIITVKVVHEADAVVSSFDGLHDTKVYQALLPLVTTLPFRVGKNMLDEHLTLLEPLGIVTTDHKRRLGYSAEAGEKACAYFSERGISQGDFVAMIFPASGNKAKNWVMSRFAEVAVHLQKTYGAKIVVIGGPGDRAEVNEFLADVPLGVSVVDASGAHSLDMLKAIIATADMFISVDAGPMHIAVAFDIPVVDILGPAPEWVLPRGTYVRGVSNQGGREPAMHPLRNRDFDYAEARRQSEAITVWQVTDAIDALCAERGVTRVS